VIHIDLVIHKFALYAFRSLTIYNYIYCWYLFIKYELAHGRGKSWDGPSSAFFPTSVSLLFDEHLLIIYISVFYDDDEIKIKLN